MGQIWDQFKADMKVANAKTAAKHRDNVNQSKSQLKEINAEARENYSAIEKPSLKGVSGTRKLWAVWLAILTAPLMLFAVVLFIIGIMFFWDAFIGL